MNLYYDEIVVGSSLRALLFAALNDFPVFFTTPEKPIEFDHFDSSVDLSSWRLHNEPQVWTTPDGETQTGQNKIALWEHLFFVLGLKGLTPFSSVCNSLRLDTNELTGYSEYAKLRSVDFGVCHYFDDHATYNLLPSENTPKTYNVYDSTKLKYLLVFYVSQTLYILRFFDLVAVPNGRLYKLLSNSYLAHSSRLIKFSLKAF